MKLSKTQLLRAFFTLYAITAAACAGYVLLAEHNWLLGGILLALSAAAGPLGLLDVANEGFLNAAFNANSAGLGVLMLLSAYHREELGRQRFNVVSGLLALAFLTRAINHSDRAPQPLQTLFGARPDAVPVLRSTYEEQIRKAAFQEERNRLARDLHDSIKQQIFAIQTSAAAAQARFTTDRDGSQMALEAVRCSAREALVEMAAMLDQLRAAPLETVGLVQALRTQCEALQYRTGAVVKLDVSEMPTEKQMPPGAAQAVFRIAQEALANVARHARATDVNVRLSVAQGDCVLMVDDNGAGFSQGNGSAGSGMGTANMQSRAAECRGHVEIRSGPGSGTTVTARLPLAAARVCPDDKKMVVQAAWLGLAALVLLGVSFALPGRTIASFARGTAIGVAIAMLMVPFQRRQA